MLDILGGIFSAILDPLVSIFFSITYGLIIRGPLTSLNYLDLAFQQVSGTNVDQLLFSTSVVDGEPQLNFFTSNSPLKTFFLIMLGAAGSLLIVFLGLILVKSITDKKGSGPIRKMGHVTLSSVLVFAIPAMFLIALSLAGGVLSAINGQHIEISSANIEVYQTNTQNRISRIRQSNDTATKSFDDQKIGGLRYRSDEEMGEAEENSNALSISEIYENLINDKNFWVKEGSPIVSLAQQNQNDYFNLKNLLITYDSSLQKNLLNEELLSNLKEVTGIIDQLKPKTKNEDWADQTKALQNQLQLISDQIDAYVKSSKELMSYETNNDTTQDRALTNFRRAYEALYGYQNEEDLGSITVIRNIQDLHWEINALINGDINELGYGLINLQQHLSSYPQNSLVVTFYQVATGNHDTNWDRSFVSLENNGSMLLIGFFLILAACIIMFLAAIFAITRIFDLALLFIISPVVVIMSAADDGARMKTWLNMVIAKLISIFGIVISLRLFSTLNDVFKAQLEAGDFPGGSGYALKLFLLAIFGIGGMLAAYKSSQMLSGIVGAGYGILDGMQMRQMSSIIRGTARVPLKAGKALSSVSQKAAGINNPRAKNLQKDRPSINEDNPNPLTRRQQMRQTWANRDQRAANLTFGLVGSKKAKSQRLTNKQNKLDAKKENYWSNKSQLAKKGQTAQLGDQKFKYDQAKENWKDFKKQGKKKENYNGD